MYTICSNESLVSCSKSRKQWPLPRFRIKPFFHHLELPVVTYCAVNWTFSSNKLSLTTKLQHQVHQKLCFFLYISTKPILYLGCVKLKHGFMCRKKHFLQWLYCTFYTVIWRQKQKNENKRKKMVEEHECVQG